MVTQKENIDNRQNVIDNWNLGPDKASILPSDNSDYWSKIAEIWGIDEVVARTQLCGNCEYGAGSSSMLLEMNSIPLDQLDLDGGGRVYCERFDFICHNLRTCQAWEDRSIMDDFNEEAMKLVLPHIIKSL